MHMHYLDSDRDEAGHYRGYPHQPPAEDQRRAHGYPDPVETQVDTSKMVVGHLLTANDIETAPEGEIVTMMVARPKKDGTQRIGVLDEILQRPLDQFRDEANPAFLKIQPKGNKIFITTTADASAALWQTLLGAGLLVNEVSKPYTPKGDHEIAA